MKHLRNVIENIKQNPESSEKLQELIWELICYSPKMPVRLHQQELINASEQVQLSVYDQYFSGKQLNFPCFKWGEGTKTILLVHGWGSKALDFYELIKEILKVPNTSVIAFDAPGNGNAEGHLSNLFLFAEGIKIIEKVYGIPDVLIGHSLGGMAGVRVLHETRDFPKLLITIAPLINLKENFIASMSGVGIPTGDQQLFLDNFEARYGQSINDFHVNQMYDFDGKVEHLLLYEQNDLVTPAADIEEFLSQHSEVKTIKLEHTTHAKIISDAIVIEEIVRKVKEI
jgi:pimeloyl-ACP methyl ester carboxylesterase